jgi:hypothetical protein
MVQLRSALAMMLSLFRVTLRMRMFSLRLTKDKLQQWERLTHAWTFVASLLCIFCYTTGKWQQSTQLRRRTSAGVRSVLWQMHWCNKSACMCSRYTLMSSICIYLHMDIHIALHMHEHIWICIWICIWSHICRSIHHGSRAYTHQRFVWLMEHHTQSTWLERQYLRSLTTSMPRETQGFAWGWNTVTTVLHVPLHVKNKHETSSS